MVHIVDAAAGKVEILHGERTIAVTDKTLVARVLRASR